MKYAIIASTFSGNKGAASMLEASIQTITAKDKTSTFTVFTVYPEEDAKQNTYDNVEVLGAKPLYLGLVINPLTLLYKILPPLRPLLRRQPHVRAFAEADVLLDQGGITFVNGREKFLIYNVATLLPALFTNTPVVKCSQAMGPFSGINKFVAKFILPRVDTICARGDITNEYLKKLSLSNVIESTDYAFLLDVTKGEAKQADEILKQSGFKFGPEGKTVGVLPSEVLRKKTEANNEDYIGYNVTFIKDLLDRGYHVLLMAYSARINKESRHNNDLPVCRDVAAQIGHKNFKFIDDELSAQQLRHIIGRLDLVVASRFHAMVAALSVGTPPLVVGWSHKYAEIMGMFNLSDSALDSKKLNNGELKKAFTKLSKDQKQSKVLIKKHLPKVRKSAAVQVDRILDIVS